MIDLENCVIVVEGSTDVQFLSTFIKSSYVITNGSSVPRETLEYLKSISKIKTIIVLTDPDYPGEKIRTTINQEIPEVLNAYVRKEHSIKKNKVGVAESTKEEVLHALSLLNINNNKKLNKGNLTEIDLYNLGINGKDNSKELRKEISEYFGLGYNNSKAILRKLNEFNISYNQLEEFINGRK